MNQLQAIRGFNDILPSQSFFWQFFEQCIRTLAQHYGYEEIRFPVVEKTELFVRSVGEVTDIVEKEMYTFEDRNGDSLTLRPEGTAACVRAALEHGLLHNQIQRLWYMGPMFRHERPQAGRYRQFYQVGFEVFGVENVYIEIELILMTARLWREVGLIDKLTLHINTLGAPEERQAYRKVLTEYFEQHSNQLDQDSQKRLHKNPLRILDSKNPAMVELIQQAPRLEDYLSETSRIYFDTLKDLLRENHINFQENPRLVRGLDYYTHGVFEWTSDQLGAQATVCAGGRYDGLVQQLGGKPTPAVGFAMGIERLLLLLETNQKLPPLPQPWIYMVSVGERPKAAAIQLAEELRNAFPATIINDTTLASFKSQMKRADKSGAMLACLIGEDELKADTISVKFLRDNSPQQTIQRTDIINFLKQYKPYGT